MDTLEPINAEEERLWSVFAHLGAFFSFIIVPLVIFLLFKDRSRAIADHAKEALNFQITVVILSAIAGFCCATIIGLIIGIPMFLVIGLFHFVLCLVGTIKASNNELYKYPLSMRLI